MGEYADYFRPFVEAGYDVVHFCLGGALSSAQKNCQLAAQEPDLAGHVFPIDSFSLSTGIALQVIEAGDRIRQGLPAAQIAQEVSALRQHCHASFILDTLTFMKAGGRCSAVVAFGANLLNLKPCIEVDNTSGAMRVGKKYRGSLEKVLPQYVRDQLALYPKVKGDHPVHHLLHHRPGSHPAGAENGAEDHVLQRDPHHRRQLHHRQSLRPQHFGHLV